MWPTLRLFFWKSCHSFVVAFADAALHLKSLAHSQQHHMFVKEGPFETRNSNSSTHHHFRTISNIWHDLLSIFSGTRYAHGIIVPYLCERRPVGGVAVITGASWRRSICSIYINLLVIHWWIFVWNGFYCFNFSPVNIASFDNAVMVIVSNGHRPLRLATLLISAVSIPRDGAAGTRIAQRSSWL